MSSKLPRKKNRTQWSVYILRCADRSLYTGIARNITERLKKHQRGLGSKYVRSRLPARIVYSEAHATRSQALKREHEIKCWTRSRKLALIVGREKEAL